MIAAVVGIALGSFGLGVVLTLLVVQSRCERIRERWERDRERLKCLSWRFAE